MKILEKLEKKVIFNITRWFALFLSFLGGLVLIAGLFFLYKSSAALFPHKTKVAVSLEEIQNSLSAQPNTDSGNQPLKTESSSGNLTNSKESIKLTIAKQIVDIIQRELNPEALEQAKETALRVTMNKASQYPESVAIKFLEGLKDIMQKAPVGQKINYGNKYFSMYQEKYNSAKEEVQNKQIESAQNISLATSLTLGGLGTIAAFGLILVLLAIERNTRLG